ncbi:MAG: hypothetical protein H2174_07205 [Vampirovibrio sp.]|jgi:hypothetical protein|nr:hypothetical protein [Vampirovibrio sp.]
MTMSFFQHTTSLSTLKTLRPARWYDAYPNLKMGLHLLYLAPIVTHSTLGEILLQLVCGYLEIPAEEGIRLAKTGTLTPAKHIRWYDEVPTLPQALTLLKQLPPSAIRQVAKAWHQQFGAALAS